MSVIDRGSPYLDRPLRTLRQVCIDIAAGQGLAEPDCDDCELIRNCLEEHRPLRRSPQKRLEKGREQAVPAPNG